MAAKPSRLEFDLLYVCPLVELGACEVCGELCAFPVLTDTAGKAKMWSMVQCNIETLDQLEEKTVVSLKTSIVWVPKESETKMRFSNITMPHRQEVDASTLIHTLGFAPVSPET